MSQGDDIRPARVQRPQRCKKKARGWLSIDFMTQPSPSAVVVIVTVTVAVAVAVVVNVVVVVVVVVVVAADDKGEGRQVRDPQG